MRVNIFIFLGLVWTAFHSPNALAAEQDLTAFCRAVSTAAVEAGRLRDEGISTQAATQALQGKYPAEEAKAGVSTAFSYKQLKEFALFDLSETYCMKMVAANGNPTDFDKLWVRTHYERAVECSVKGQFEREPFQRCWEAQQVRDTKGTDKIVLSVMNLEYILAEKRTCETRFPKYDAQNRQALLGSSFSRISSEAMIDTYSGIGAKQGLLRGLVDLRRKASSIYLEMEAAEFERRCQNFPGSLDLGSKK